VRRLIVPFLTILVGRRHLNNHDSGETNDVATCACAGEGHGRVSISIFFVVVVITVPLSFFGSMNATGSFIIFLLLFSTPSIIFGSSGRGRSSFRPLRSPCRRPNRPPHVVVAIVVACRRVWRGDRYNVRVSNNNDRLLESVCLMLGNRGSSSSSSNDAIGLGHSKMFKYRMVEQELAADTGQSLRNQDAIETCLGNNDERQCIQMVRNFAACVESSEAGPPTSSMLSLLNTSSQRKTASRCWTSTYLGAANNRPSSISVLTYS
jgi:hypothetical protein